MSHATQVNSSGFVFQMAIQDSVRALEGSTKWRIISPEYPWRDEEAKASGFIDLLVGRTRNRLNERLIVECKRFAQTNWIFLCPTTAPAQEEVARVGWADIFAGSAPLHGWDDVSCRASSCQAEFCVVRGAEHHMPVAPT